MENDTHGRTIEEILNDIENADYLSEREKMIIRTQAFYKFTKWTESDYEEYDELYKKLKKSYRKCKKGTDDKEKMKTKEKGDALESIVNFIINKSFFLEVYPNKRTSTHEIDQFIVLSDYGKQTMYEYKFSHEFLGFDNGYFIGECKNYDEEVSATWVGKFYTLLRTCGHCSLGIIFSYEGLTGKENNWYHAHGLTKVIYQLEPNDKKIFILDFNKDDFKKLFDKKQNLFKIIDKKKLALISGSKSGSFDDKHEGEEEIIQIYEEIKKII
jgi:hypothetical protein